MPLLRQIATALKRPVGFVLAVLDWLTAWILLLPFKIETWRWVARFFPRVSGHFNTSAQLTFWALVVAALYLVLVPLPYWYARQLPETTVGERGERVYVDKLEKEEGFRTLMVQAAGGLLVLLALARGWAEFRLARERHDLDRDARLAERFTKAVDQLGHGSIDVRIGGIFALEKIAKTSREYHWTIMEVLTAFVREHAPLESEEAVTSEPGAATGRGEGEPAEPEQEQRTRKPAEDVQVALTVIGRRNASWDPFPGVLNLALTWLVRSNLEEADLGHALLAGANLGGANLWCAYLPLVCFDRANLDAANLEGANLESAKLRGASLKDANFQHANLERADLEYAHLEGANLRGAHLEGADFEYANLERSNLEGANLKGANLFEANLNEASLCKAHLEGAYLGNARLRKADLRDAHAQQARLECVDLDEASLLDAHLEGASLRFARMALATGMTWDQLQSAETFEGATLPHYLVNTPEGWSPDYSEPGADEQEQ